MSRMLISLSVILILSSPLCHSAQPKFYWLIPTHECLKFNITFNEISDNFGMIDGQNSATISDEIVFLQSPEIPYDFLFSLESVPTRFDEFEEFNRSLSAFKSQVDKIKPNFNGLALIDSHYCENIQQGMIESSYSYHPIAIDSSDWRMQESIRKYTEQLMKEESKLVRDRAHAGHYGHAVCPLCDEVTRDGKMVCFPKSKPENDRISWLWQQQNIIYPKINVPERFSYGKNLDQITEQLDFAERIVKQQNSSLRVDPYFLICTMSDNLLSEELLSAILQKFIKRQYYEVILASNLWVWSKEKCEEWHNYLNRGVGPAVIAARMYAATRHFTSTNLRTHSRKMKNNSLTSIESTSEEDFIMTKEGNNSQPRSHPLSIVIFCFCLWTTQLLAVEIPSGLML